MWGLLITEGIAQKSLNYKVNIIFYLSEFPNTGKSNYAKKITGGWRYVATIPIGKINVAFHIQKLSKMVQCAPFFCMHETTCEMLTDFPELIGYIVEWMNERYWDCNMFPCCFGFLKEFFPCNWHIQLTGTRHSPCMLDNREYIVICLHFMILL
jgi:hypothetical protein